jgi:hypothetical protein
MTRFQALAAIDRKRMDRRVVGSILVCIVVVDDGRGFARLYGQIFVVVCRIRRGVYSAEKDKDGLLEGLHWYLAWNSDGDVSVPMYCVDDIADRKCCVGLVLGGVLSEDHVSPGLV